jgi:hypothetical protein
VKGKRGIQRISQHVVKIVVGQPLTMRESVWMHHDEGTELFRLCEKRTKLGIG